MQKEYKVIVEYRNNKVLYTKWFNQQKQLHREDGPAIEYADGSKEWRLNGKRHRTDGPAVEYADGTKEWFFNGKRHRTDGPAVEYADGSKQWFLNDKRHRADGPASEWADGSKEWWLNGKWHPQPSLSCDGKVVEIDGKKYQLKLVKIIVEK